MTRIEYTNTMAYEFHPERNGAKYKIGEKFKNGGEFLESIAKHHRGLEYLVNPATSYDKGSDIESEHASVKSGKASLARVHAETFDEILEIYFANVASTKWIYMIKIDEIVTEYHMNRNEFEAFVRMFGRLGVESGKHEKKIKFLATSSKTIAWLEARVEGQTISLFFPSGLAWRAGRPGRREATRAQIVKYFTKSNKNFFNYF